MGAIVHPAAAHLDELAGADHRRMANHGDQVALSRALTRSTQNPVSGPWNVTRSTTPAKASVGAAWAIFATPLLPQNWTPQCSS